MSDIPREIVPPPEVAPTEPVEPAQEAPVETPQLSETAAEAPVDGDDQPAQEWPVDDDIAGTVEAYRDDRGGGEEAPGEVTEAFNEAAPPQEPPGREGGLTEKFNEVAKPEGTGEGETKDEGGNDEAKLEHERKDWNPPPHLRGPRFTP